MLSFPKFSDLYYADRTIRGSLTLLVMPLLLVGGFYWVTQPIPGVEPISGPSFEAEIAPYVPIVGGSLAVLGLLIFLRRFLFIRSVLASGIVVKGMVEKIETVETETSKDSSHGFRNYRRTYFATMTYSVNGLAQKVCQRLPHSPSANQVLEGREVELVVLTSAPSKPLIKSVYAGKAKAEPQVRLKLP